jgi:hypothetical protein
MKELKRVTHKAGFFHPVRNIRMPIQRELWGRAAGRCQFSGCNRLVYKSPITQESVNVAEMAHIYSFSPHGPRGHGPFKRIPALLNESGNLLLVCHDCHKKIDKHKDGGRYAPDLIRQWKIEHERRIALVTGIAPRRKSTVVLYGAKIGDERSPLQHDLAEWAMFPNWYPADEHPIQLGMTWEGKDDQIDYWGTEEKNLMTAFERYVVPHIAVGEHFSVFGFAPIPLLVRLGTLFTDKIAAQVYQLGREPQQSWQWSARDKAVYYRVIRPSSFKYAPALIISLSARISHERVTSILGKRVSVWELTVREPHNDFLRTKAQLSKFRETARRLMVEIARKDGQQIPLAIFPALPVATAIELGRIRMPKADMPWVIYDHNNKTRSFIKALEITGGSA